MRTLVAICILFITIDLNAAENIQYLKAFAKLEQGDYKESIQLFSELLNENKHDLGKIYFARAMAFYNQGNYVKAKSDFIQAGNNHIKSSNLWIAKASLMLRNSDEMYLYLERYINSNFTPEIHQLRKDTVFHSIVNTSKWNIFWNGIEFNEKEQFYSSIIFSINQKDYNSAIINLTLLEDDYYKFYYLAVAFDGLNDFPKALEYINNALKLNYTIDAFNLKNSLLVKNGYLQHAIENCKELTEKIPEHFDAYVELAQLQLEANQYSEVEKLTELLMNLFPNKIEVLKLSIKIDLYANNKLNALQSIQKCIELNGIDSELYSLRGKAYYLSGLYKLAKEDYAMSLDLNPNSAELYYEYGNVLYKLQLKNEACHSWKKAFEYGYTNAMRDIIKICE